MQVTGVAEKENRENEEKEITQEINPKQFSRIEEHEYPD